MARQLRTEYAGALSHVMSRGNNGDKIFCGKKAIAALLASQTLVSTEWIAEQLQMGHRSAASQLKKWAKETKEGKMWLSKLS